MSALCYKRNVTSAEMDAIVGLSPFPRVKIPSMPPSGPITLNNIKLDNSVVGAINTGVVRDIDVNLTHLQQAGLDKARDAIGMLTRAVLSAPGLTDEQRNELIERVAFLSSEAASDASQRKPGMIKATLGAVAAAAAGISSIAGAWSACEPILKEICGFK